MINARKITPIVDAAVKKVDRNVIVERTFYDEVSARVFVTIVKGPRKTEIVLPARYFENSSTDQIDRAVKEGIKRLEHTPIG